MSTDTLLEEPELSQSLRRLWVSPFNSWRYVIVWLILISPLLVRVWFLSKVPDIGEPFNIDQFCLVEIPTGQNAFDHYREASRLIGAIFKAKNSGASDDDHNAVIANGWSAATDSLKAWLADSREALAEWRLGTECPDALYFPFQELGSETEIPVISSLRAFTMIAQCEAARLESNGDFAEAGKLYVASFRSSRHCGRHGDSSNRHYGCILHFFSWNGLIHWAECPEVTAEQLRWALSEVRAADRMTEPLSASLKADYVLANNFFKRADWLEECGLAPGSFAKEPAVTGMRAYYWLIGEPQATLRVLRQALVNQLNDVDKPLPERQPIAGTVAELLFQPDPNVPLKPNQLNPAALDRAFQRSNVTKQFAGVKSLEFSVARERARQVTLEVALAAQAYRRDHGEFPEDPVALIPSYLDAWPVDPSHKTGQTIQYRRETPLSAIVWSLGNDGHDDGGDVSTDDRNPLDIGVPLKTR